MTAVQGYDPFALVRAALEGPAIPEVPPSSPPPFRRLLTAMADPSASSLDLLVLLRHTLRCEEARGGQAPSVIVSDGLKWPKTADWEVCGLEVSPRPGGLAVRARRWRPDWLPDVPDEGVDGAASGETPRHSAYGRVTGDPFLTTFDFSEYRTAGQRSSIRAALTAPAGSTLVVSLPTGDGKSLVYQSIARFGFGDEGRGVTLVVTPTVALALDQEVNLRLLGFGEGPFAYRAGDQVTNDQLCDRIRTGTQSICFASPEAVCNSALRGALEAATRDGLLRAVVLDEAHLIDSWGINFRPDFQVLSAIRRAWLAKSEEQSTFRTILLSATLTADTIENLRSLFPPHSAGTFAIVSAARLRPEIDYWVAPKSPDRARRVMEALLHLPRPAILYTSERAQAYGWYRALRDRGFRRIGVVTGESTAQERERVIEGWRQGTIDLAVGTSAFGLGIDNPYVRAVVHACVPETLDRFYQEVGRGGRDGHASVSLILPSERDRGIARSINRERLLTVEKAEPRWRAMFGSLLKKPVESEVFRLPVDVQPGFDSDRIDMVGPKNTGWNVRALILLASMGAIDLTEAPDRLVRDVELTLDESDDSNPEPTQPVREHTFVEVRIRDSEHLSDDFWKARVQAYRDRRNANAGRSLDLLLDYLTSDGCLAEILAPTYAVPANAEADTPAINVARACGGCPGCRKAGRSPYVHDPDVPLHPWKPRRPDAKVASLLRSGHLTVVMPDDGITGPMAQRSFREAVYGLVRLGVRNVILLGEPDLDCLRLDQADAPFCFVDDWPGLSLPPGPALVQIGDGARVSAASLHPRTPEEGRIWFLPPHVPDPRRPGRLLVNNPPGLCLTLSEFQSEMSR